MWAVFGISCNDRLDFIFTVSCSQCPKTDKALLPCSFDRSVLSPFDFVAPLFQLLGILRTNIVKAVLLKRNANALFKLGAVGCHVHKGQFKLDAGIEEVQKTAPFLENRRLILLLGELIIDVLILDGAGVVVGLHPAGAILKHPLHGDGLLGGPGHSSLRRYSAKRSGLNISGSHKRNEAF